MEAYHSITLDRTAEAYIEVLIANIETRTVEGLGYWVEHEAPRSLADEIHNEIFDDYGEPIDYHSQRQIIRDRMRIYLRELGRKWVAFTTHGSKIFPWDILHGVQWTPRVEEGTSQAFLGHYPMEYEDKLLVQFRKDSQIFHHDLTDEFAFGILLFAYAAELQVDARLFEQPFEYFNSINDRFNTPGSFAIIEVDGRDYHFQSLDFLQGFKTGALWAGLDHRDYWRNLRVLNLVNGRMRQMRFE